MIPFYFTKDRTYFYFYIESKNVCYWDKVGFFLEANDIIFEKSNKPIKRELKTSTDVWYLINLYNFLE